MTNLIVVMLALLVLFAVSAFVSRDESCTSERRRGGGTCEVTYWWDRS